MAHRTERLNELFRRELSRLLLTEIKDPRVLGVTVTEVRVTNDLSYAEVFLTVDDTEDADQALEGLDRAAGFIRRSLGQELHLRKIPEFRFELDTTMSHAGRIEELLRQAAESDAEIERAREQDAEGGENPDSASGVNDASDG